MLRWQNHRASDDSQWRLHAIQKTRRICICLSPPCIRYTRPPKAGPLDQWCKRGNNPHWGAHSQIQMGRTVVKQTIRHQLPHVRNSHKIYLMSEMSIMQIYSVRTRTFVYKKMGATMALQIHMVDTTLTQMVHQHSHHVKKVSTLEIWPISTAWKYIYQNKWTF